VVTLRERENTVAGPFPSTFLLDAGDGKFRGAFDPE
jgi:hypothetical protein